MDDFYNDGKDMDENNDHDEHAFNGGQDSVYSYSYKNRDKSSAVHEGDYDARRDAYSYYYDARQEDTQRKHEKKYRSRKTGNGFIGKVVKCAVLAAVFGLVSGSIFRGIAGTSLQKKETASDDQQHVSEQLEKTATNSGVTKDESVIVSDVSGIVEQVMPSIVSITNMSQTEYYSWFGGTRTEDSESAGSGIIVSDDDTYLYIATNNHVVAGANSLTICFFDDKTVAAEIKGTDETSDLAVVSVKKQDMDAETLANVKVATIGDSDALQAGQSAIAIGNALGYGQSVTTGVISALERQVTTVDSETGESTTNELIQTDAAINPGNSGGALLNINGEVIGINSVKYSDTDVEGMGYAIPTNTAKPIVDELIERHVVDESKSAFLGINGVDVTEEVSAAYHMPEGIYIAQVSKGSAAEQAGVVRGDILCSFDGHKISSMKALDEQLQYYEAGTVVEVVVKRASNGEYAEKTISVTLGSKK